MRRFATLALLGISLMGYTRANIDSDEYDDDAVNDGLYSGAEEMYAEIWDDAVRDGEDIWIFDVYMPGCKYCVELDPHFDEAADLARGVWRFGKIDLPSIEKYDML